MKYFKQTVLNYSIYLTIAKRKGGIKRNRFVENNFEFES